MSGIVPLHRTTHARRIPGFERGGELNQINRDNERDFFRRFIDDQLSPAEFLRFEEQLLADPELRTRYVHYVGFEAAIGEMVSSARPLFAEPARPSSPPRKRRASTTLLAGSGYHRYQLLSGPARSLGERSRHATSGVVSGKFRSDSGRHDFRSGNASRPGSGKIQGRVEMLPRDIAGSRGADSAGLLPRNATAS